MNAINHNIDWLHLCFIPLIQIIQTLKKVILFIVLFMLIYRDKKRKK